MKGHISIAPFMSIPDVEKRGKGRWQAGAGGGGVVVVR